MYSFLSVQMKIMLQLHPSDNCPKDGPKQVAGIKS